MVFHRHNADNHGLTRAPYVLASGRGYWKLAFSVLILMIAVALLAAGATIRYLERPAPAPAPAPVVEPSPHLEALERENRELREALNRSRFEFEVELATRNELERQVQNLNEQLGQLREELAFIKSATKREAGK